MKRNRIRARVCASLVLIAGLSACSSMRGASHRAPPATPPPASTDEPALPPQPPEPNPPETNAENSPPRVANATIPPCVPAETKAKPKVKPKPTRREAPPPPPSTPAGEEVPPDGVVDAQVKPMPVPVMSILGKRVQSPKGEDLGRVVDVLADASGRVRIAIVDFGGFLGVGNRRIAVEWPLLRFNPDRRDPPSLLLSLSQEKLKAAPEYKDNPLPQTLMVPPPLGPASTPAPAGQAPAPAGQAPAPPEQKTPPDNKK